MSRTTEQSPKAASAGFSLIELLTVIAVIAILAALIFPATQMAIEKGRQGTAIDHMAKIQTALAQYYLDNNRKYPPVLFAYSDGTSSMQNIKSAGPGYVNGLYPNYINDASVFTDPDNPVSDTSSTMSVQEDTNGMNPDGTLAPVQPPKKFFVGDAFDISPHIIGPKNTDNTYVPRYQLAWTRTPAPAGQTNQLDQPASTDDTYVTMTTYHVKGSGADKILVLFKKGNVKTFDTSRLLTAQCGDVTDITTSTANFWQIKPTGSCP